MFPRFFDFFSDAPTPAPAGMRVVPCSALDVEQRHTVLTTGLVIDSPLDAQKLEHSLSTLVERKFPRAGARLAIRNKVYEFHIPCTFDSHTPAIAFTADRHHEPYWSRTRPDLRSLVNCSDSEPLFCRFPSLKTYLISKKCPTSTAEFLRSNTPMLQVHVSVFDDLTLIGVTAPHLMFDAPGIGILLHAWTRLLSGDDIDAIPGMEWDVAPFETFRGPNAVNCVRGYGYLIPDKYPPNIYEPCLSLVVSWIRSRIRNREVNRLIRVPKAFLEDRRREIMENLKLQGSSEWVTSSDVLLAWWIKTSYSLHKSDDPTGIFIHIPVDLRSKLIFPTASILTKPYINNASSTISVPPFAVKTLHTESLGDLALRIRRATTLYNTDLLAFEHELRWRNANLDYKIFNIHRCPPGAESELQTNWCDARLSDLDFSQARAPGSQKTARVLFVLADAVMADDYMSKHDAVQYNCTSLRGNGAILMEDEDAIWMSQVKGIREWEKLRRSGRFKLI
ncbi:hypothetical protein FB451DRAFT_1138498 [Mycena latifolia]|nr:hypothetical protein FB451DRAFT_1138498 [Mycena latifolia]